LNTKTIQEYVMDLIQIQNTSIGLERNSINVKDLYLFISPKQRFNDWIKKSNYKDSVSIENEGPLISY